MQAFYVFCCKTCGLPDDKTILWKSAVNHFWQNSNSARPFMFRWSIWLPGFILHKLTFLYMLYISGYSAYHCTVTAIESTTKKSYRFWDFLEKKWTISRPMRSLKLFAAYWNGCWTAVLRLRLLQPITALHSTNCSGPNILISTTIWICGISFAICTENLRPSSAKLVFFII